MKMKTLAVLATLFASTLFAHSGNEIFTENCASCHTNVLGVNVDEQGEYSYISPAPYITELVSRLKSHTKNEEEFTAFIRDYINDPDKRKSLYGKNALRVFGLMPTLKGAISDEEVSMLAKYLYNDKKSKNKTVAKEEIKTLDSREALFVKNCSSCHEKVIGVNVDEQGTYSYISEAPYITELVAKLKSKTENEDQFISFIQSYINNPDKRKSLYGKRAIKKFGLMPTLKGVMTDEESAGLAKYLYERY